MKALIQARGVLSVTKESSHFSYDIIPVENIKSENGKIYHSYSVILPKDYVGTMDIDKVWMKDEKNFPSVHQFALPVFVVLLLEKAAEALVVAIATRLGERLADAFTAWLLGRGDDNAYEREVLTRLGQIESKIDTVLEILIQIPGVVQAIVSREITEGDRRTLNSKIKTLNITYNDYLKNLQSDGDLRKAVDEVLELGDTILQAGQEWYMAGVRALGAAMPVYSKLIDKDERHADSFARKAKDYRILIQGWIDPAVPNSFAAVRSTLQNQYDEAKKAIDNVRSHFAIGLTRIYGTGHLGLGPGWVATTAFLGPWDKTIGSYINCGRDPSSRWLPNFVPLEDAKIHELHDDIAVYDWLAPLPREGHPDSWWIRAVGKANLFRRRIDQIPEQLKEIDVAIASVSAMLDACAKIEQLVHRQP